MKKVWQRAFEEKFFNFRSSKYILGLTWRQVWVENSMTGCCFHLKVVCTAGCRCYHYFIERLLFLRSPRRLIKDKQTKTFRNKNFFLSFFFIKICILLGENKIYNWKSKQNLTMKLSLKKKIEKKSWTKVDNKEFHMISVCQLKVLFIWFQLRDSSN